MAKIKVRAAFRDWDYLTPLLLGDITSDLVDLDITRVAALATDFAETSTYDTAEMSFSRYVSGRVAGDTRVVGLPNFLMRGFRHRCLITHVDSPITRFEQLQGKRIGVTGWRDSGNTWTRAALYRHGIDVANATWYAGRLTDAHPDIDRLEGFGQAGRIEAVQDGTPMVELLETGGLDAVMTPFMPPGFFSPASTLRPLLRDFRAEERAYYTQTGYVPGMHILAFKQDFARTHPEAVAECNRLINLAKHTWLEKRRKYADTTPWAMADLYDCGQHLAARWDSSELADNAVMIEDFCHEMHRQNLIAQPLTAEQVFPHALTP